MSSPFDSSPKKIPRKEKLVRPEEGARPKDATEQTGPDAEQGPTPAEQAREIADRQLEALGTPPPLTDGKQLKGLRYFAQALNRSNRDALATRDRLGNLPESVQDPMYDDDVAGTAAAVRAVANDPLAHLGDMDKINQLVKSGLPPELQRVFGQIILVEGEQSPQAAFRALADKLDALQGEGGINAIAAAAKEVIHDATSEEADSVRQGALKRVMETAYGGMMESGKWKLVDELEEAGRSIQMGRRGRGDRPATPTTGDSAKIASALRLADILLGTDTYGHLGTTEAVEAVFEDREKAQELEELLTRSLPDQMLESLANDQALV